MNALQYAKSHAVSPDKQKIFDLSLQTYKMKKSYEIFQTMYIDMISVSKHGTNSKIHFKYNYKENFLRTQEKMETSYVCLGLSFTVLLGRKCFNV